MYNNVVVFDTAIFAGMAELADAQDSDSCPRKSGAGSSPVIRIKLSE